MILGIVGPVLVLFHSNFNLGSFNSTIALFCTIVVASSGLLGRYLYAKVHRGLYGQRLSFKSIQQEIKESRSSNATLGTVLPLINQGLQPFEDAVTSTQTSLSAAARIAITTTLNLLSQKRKLTREVRDEIARLAATSEVFHQQQKRLLVTTLRYLNYRIGVLRIFAQLMLCERLFSLWHVVHYPLFMVLVIAAILHVIAVHMY